MSTINIQTYKVNSGLFSNPAKNTIHNIIIGCVYSTTEVWLDGFTGSQLASYQVGAIKAVALSNSCNGDVVYCKGQAGAIASYCNKCCPDWGTKVSIVDLINPDGVAVCVGGRLNYVGGLKLNMSDYNGASSVTFYNDAEIIAFFAAIGEEIKIVGCELVFKYSSQLNLKDIEKVTVPPPIATIEVKDITTGGVYSADNNDIIITYTNGDGTKPTSADKFQITSNMNGVNIDTGLVTWGDGVALAALNWLSVGLSHADGSPLIASDFLFNNATGVLSILNVVKNAMVITNHPTMVGNPLLYRPIPSVSKAFDINLTTTFYTAGTIQSNVANGVIHTDKFIEYISAFIGKGTKPTSLSSNFDILSNVLPQDNNLVAIDVVMDGVAFAKNTSYFSAISANMVLHYRGADTETAADSNASDPIIAFSSAYILPYSNVLASVQATDYKRIGFQNTNYDSLFVNNMRGNEAQFVVTNLIWPYNSERNTQHSYSVKLDGLTPVTTPGVTYPIVRTPSSPIYNVNNNYNFKALAVGPHELVMSAELTNIAGTGANFTKTSSTKIYVSPR
jgi:hypothetical protein